MEENKKQEIQRIGKNFIRELNDVNKKRIEHGFDNKKLSIRLITEIIIRHNLWLQIKNDLIRLNLGELKIEK